MKPDTLMNKNDAQLALDEVEPTPSTKDQKMPYQAVLNYKDPPITVGKMKPDVLNERVDMSKKRLHKSHSTMTKRLRLQKSSTKMFGKG